MFDALVRVYGMVWLFVIPIRKEMDVTVSTTQIRSRERCATFLLGGDLWVPIKMAAKQTADRNTNTKRTSRMRWINWGGGMNKLDDDSNKYEKKKEISPKKIE